MGLFIKTCISDDFMSSSLQKEPFGGISSISPGFWQGKNVAGAVSVGASLNMSLESVLQDSSLDQTSLCQLIEVR